MRVTCWTKSHGDITALLTRRFFARSWRQTRRLPTMARSYRAGSWSSFLTLRRPHLHGPEWCCGIKAGIPH
ncbi:hypothetical protein Murka_0026 [Xanthomonas phage Murka]|uniref:Putative tail protein n=1 Tax=Xanthomonas phage FoX1 TaxID=2723897 RepID=A0A858NPD2_9CAUD|nr:putative tail protein [Xanthomonas phage FoX1]QJB21765.1 putative tail protein [Xanthomonas phage FoX1]WNL50862.1 hypothetical protein Murka_0026 [Xanthomonas phage Murka]